jgi:uncharacterized protein (TIGR03067 family)
MPKWWVTNMQESSSTTRRVAWVALVLFVAALLLSSAMFVVFVNLGDVSRTSVATITTAAGVGFAWLLALILGVVGWRHAAGKVAAIGAVLLGVLATVVVWQQFSRPTSPLDGTWQAVRIEAEDGTSGNDMASVTSLTIAGEKLKVTLGAANIDGFITTDTTRSPKTFDAQGSSKEGAKLNWSGIYEFDGDTLKLCMGEPGARPKEFKSNPATLWVLKRLK